MTDGDDLILRQIVGYNIKRANSALLASLSRLLEPFGLRRLTFSCLAVIDALPGLRQADLADALAIDRPNIVQIVNELEAAGLVRRQRSLEDRRAYELFPTEKGSEISRASVQAVMDWDRTITGYLDEQERATLIDLLRRIETNSIRIWSEE